MRYRAIDPRSVAQDLLRAFLDAPELDIAIAVVAFVGLLVSPAVHFRDAHLDPAVIALSAITAVPLVIRSRYPVGVLTVVMAGLLACLAVFQPEDAAVGIAMIVSFTVGFQGRRVRSLVVGAAMAPVVAAAAAISTADRVGVGEIVARLALILAALAAGDAFRGRRALATAGVEEAERAREASARHHFDEERLRLARELHDTVAHTLVGINVRAAAAAHRQRDEPGEGLTVLEEIKRSSAEALTELRATLRLLRLQADEAPMSPTQNLDDLRQLVDRVAGAGLDVQLQVDALPHDLPIPISHAAYRIVQESLTNVLRHSDATRAVVNVVAVKGSLVVQVDDNGRSSAGSDQTQSGHGIQGMNERAAALGGSCTANSGPDGGWRVCADLPIHRAVA